MSSAKAVGAEASGGAGQGSGRGFSGGTVAALGEVRQEDEEASVQEAGSAAKKVEVEAGMGHCRAKEVGSLGQGTVTGGPKFTLAPAGFSGKALKSFRNVLNTGGWRPRAYQHKEN